MLRAFATIAALSSTGCFAAFGYHAGRATVTHGPAELGEQAIVYHRDGTLLGKGELETCPDNLHICIVETTGTTIVERNKGTAFSRSSVGKVESATTHELLGTLIGLALDLGIATTVTAFIIANSDWNRSWTLDANGFR